MSESYNSVARNVSEYHAIEVCKEISYVSM